MALSGQPLPTGFRCCCCQRVTWGGRRDFFHTPLGPDLIGAGLPQVWKLSATDLCEIARNSVLHSGFPHQVSPEP